MNETWKMKKSVNINNCNCKNYNGELQRINRDNNKNKWISEN